MTADEAIRREGFALAANSIAVRVPPSIGDVLGGSSAVSAGLVFEGHRVESYEPTTTLLCDGGAFVGVEFDASTPSDSCIANAAGPVARHTETSCGPSCLDVVDLHENKADGNVRVSFREGRGNRESVRYFLLSPLLAHGPRPTPTDR